MAIVIKPCKVPWSVSPSMSGLTLTYAETDIEPECSIVFGGGRIGPTGLTDMRRIELQFSMAGQVRCTAKGDDEDIDALGFHVAGGYDGPIEDYLQWRRREWQGTGLCPDSGFYVAADSDWLQAAGLKHRNSAGHFILAGRDCYIEVIADSFSWREWLWPDGHRDSHQDERDVVASGRGTE